ncbi:uncharacterized protein TRIADDRAFT_52066 [Trichoplax adhaerens]|uniref:protein adenylyltransferase n=1 Tax=Trichoplax adhaerens TaxID=10228 RepID=B3RLN6_TRIAD|nr:hypothetical protein TRIADDRAFT_52066 [Trichoplax adhaerens]EDV29557.1 hypothetical protein TRIADDRAFT_52066 [Trichoplax adhaerens]|eukprot:XP_002108759.1 hypothetical protein TRIADDRAFT_52066 [Trichoplax adhaerens]
MPNKDGISHCMSGFLQGKHQGKSQLNKSPAIPATTNLTKEVIYTLKQAWRSARKGDKKKATKLFVYAIRMAPRHPDVLNNYGEFLEHEDVIQAEYYYTAALSHYPYHQLALSNRKRTLPLVQQIDRDRLARIAAKRSKFYALPLTDPALIRMKRESYYQHVYHTVAIEGNTMNLQMTRAVIENRIAIGGKSVMEHNEIIGMDEALSYINTTLINKAGLLDVQDILQIHRRVYGFSDPFEAGNYRNSQVYIADHVPPPPGQVAAKMTEFDNWLKSSEARQLHPIELAALAHYKLVHIHPFVDGNGRTARLFMNCILMRAGFPPIIIRVHDRFHYYQYLSQANDGDVRPFMRFIADTTEFTLDEYLNYTSVPAIIELNNARRKKNDDVNTDVTISKESTPKGDDKK